MLETLKSDEILFYNIDIDLILLEFADLNDQAQSSNILNKLQNKFKSCKIVILCPIKMEKIVYYYLSIGASDYILTSRY